MSNTIVQHNKKKSNIKDIYLLFLIFSFSVMCFKYVNEYYCKSILFLFIFVWVATKYGKSLYKGINIQCHMSSFDRFLQYKGQNIKQSTRQEAIYFLRQHGTTYSIWDYWGAKDRAAWWKAIEWTDIAEQKERSLHQRCSAIRLSRWQWSIFLQHVTPWQPEVPKLPS